MDTTGLLVDGLKLLVIGMGTVYVFLGIMIFWMRLSAGLARRFSTWLPDPEPASPKKAAAKKAVAAPKAAESTRIAAVAAAAIEAHRQAKK